MPLSLVNPPGDGQPRANRPRAELLARVYPAATSVALRFDDQRGNGALVAVSVEGCNLVARVRRRWHQQPVLHDSIPPSGDALRYNGITIKDAVSAVMRTTASTGKTSSPLEAVVQRVTTALTAISAGNARPRVPAPGPLPSPSDVSTAW